MLAQKNLYAELRLQPSASASEIRSAYRRAALSAHPDKGGNAVAFHSIAFAYEVLSCNASRQLYDQMSIKRSTRRCRFQTSPKDACAKAPKNVVSQKCASFGARKRKIAAPSPATKRKDARIAPSSGNAFGMPETTKGNENRDEENGHAPTQEKDHAVRSTLQQLRVALQALPAVQRRAAIMQMSVSVRTELFKHMSRSDAPDDDVTAQVGSARGVKVRSRPADSWSRGTDIRAMKRNHNTIYQVQLRLRHLRMYTRGQGDIESAIAHQMHLIRARQAIFAADEEIWDDPHRFHEVFTSTLASVGTSPEELGLSVFIFMRADEWICRCATITSPVLALKDAVATHSRLLMARRSSWHKLRAEWVPLMRQTQTARLRRLSQEQAEAVADKARHTLLERKVKKAVRAAEWAIIRRSRQKQQEARARAKALRQARKKNAAMSARQRRVAREERLRRAARRRWYRRADLTMEEIMQGAPTSTPLP